MTDTSQLLVYQDSNLIQKFTGKKTKQRNKEKEKEKKNIRKKRKLKELEEVAEPVSNEIMESNNEIFFTTSFHIGAQVIKPP